MKLFRTLFVFDTLALLVLLYFFVDGLRYATNDNYVGLWLVMLLVPSGLLAGAWVLQSKGKTAGANILLGVLAAPFVLGLVLIGLFVVLQPDMR